MNPNNSHFRAQVAELAEDVRYLLDCVTDGDSDPVAITECVQHLGQARAYLAAEPVAPVEGPLRIALNELLDDIDALVSESEGVAGLHLNGDIAPWSDLLEGGRFEEWLLSVSRGRAALEAEPEAPVGPTDAELLDVWESDECEARCTSEEADSGYRLPENEIYGRQQIAFARAVLTRYGSTPPQPVERSPELIGIEDRAAADCRRIPNAVAIANATAILEALRRTAENEEPCAMPERVVPGAGGEVYLYWFKFGTVHICCDNDGDIAVVGDGTSPQPLPEAP